MRRKKTEFEVAFDKVVEAIGRGTSDDLRGMRCPCGGGLVAKFSSMETKNALVVECTECRSGQHVLSLKAHAPPPWAGSLPPGEFRVVRTGPAAP